jgi:hypothetical protein
VAGRHLGLADPVENPRFWLWPVPEMAMTCAFLKASLRWISHLLLIPSRGNPGSMDRMIARPVHRSLPWGNSLGGVHRGVLVVVPVRFDDGETPQRGATGSWRRLRDVSTFREEVLSWRRSDIDRRNHEVCADLILWIARWFDGGDGFL